MSHQSEARFLVLHGSKLKGFAESSAIAGLVGMKTKAVEVELVELSKAGYVMHRDGRIAGWMLTPEGREHHHELLVRDLKAMKDKGKLRACYDEFLGWNRELLSACTAWQMRDVERHISNDHSDRGYDREVIERLAAIHTAVTPITARLAAIATRFDPYAPRLKNAITKVKRGERDWFAKPLIDSYHTVWMELHEDLLATLDLTREQQPDADDDLDDEDDDTPLSTTGRRVRHRTS